MSDTAREWEAEALALGFEPTQVGEGEVMWMRPDDDDGGPRYDTSREAVEACARA